MEASTLKSLFIIFFIVFCTTQAISAQTCQEALSPKNTVVLGSPPKTPLPIKDGLSKGERQFRTAYNRGFFEEDERYISISPDIFGKESMDLLQHVLNPLEKKD